MPRPAAILGRSPLQALVADIYRIVGQANARFLDIPGPYESINPRDYAGVAGRGWTLNAGSTVGRYSKQGAGWMRSYDDATNWQNVPDANDLSFGDSAVDSPFSLFAVLNPLSAANDRRIAAKFNAPSTAREWDLTIRGAAAQDKLFFELVDESVVAAPNVMSNVAISVGAGVFSTVAATYSASPGGASAANAMAIYENGAVKASTATNSGTYVAMENLGAGATIGSSAAGSGNFYSGGIGLVLLVAGVLTAAQIADLHARCRRHFGF